MRFEVTTDRRRFFQIAAATAALLGSLIIFPQLFSRAAKTVTGRLKAPSTEGADTTAAGAVDDEKEA